MTAADVALVIRSIMREYGLQLGTPSVVPLGRAWIIDLVNTDGMKQTLTVSDGSPQMLRWSLMTALNLDVD